MTRSMMRWIEVFSLVGLAGVLLPGLGCEKSETHRDDSAAASDAGPSKVSDEPDLAKAVASVAASRPMAAGNGAADGPPPDGIFAPGAADKALAKGAPAQLTLGSDGAAPRVQLGPAAKPGSKRTGSIEIATQNDPRQGAIPISLALTIEAQKPKGDSDAGAPAFTQMVAKVSGATINAPGVPAEIAASVAKLKGSHVDYQVTPDGAGSNFRFDASKAADPAFRDAVHSLSDVLAVLTVPFPSKPVGVGAYWMVTSRDVVMGLDVVSYRLIKVEKVEGTLVTLDLNTKRYAASPAFDVEGLPPEVPHRMVEFHASGEGKLTISAGEAFPKAGQLESVMAAALGAPDPKTKQSAGVQSQTRVTIAF